MSHDDRIKKKIEKLKKQYESTHERNMRILMTAFVILAIGFVYIVYNMPELNDQEKSILFRIPRSGKDYIALHTVISKYSENNYSFMMLVFCYLYILLQSFAIPGTIVLSFLAGALFGWFNGTILVCACATTGSTICYQLSNTLAKYAVLQWFPEKIVEFHKKMDENRNNQFWFMLFLRFTPLIPNVVVNMASPIVGMPVHTFAFGTFLGLMPANAVHIRTGMEVSTFDPAKGTARLIGMMLCLSAFSLIPMYFTKKIDVDEMDKDD